MFKIKTLFFVLLCLFPFFNVHAESLAQKLSGKIILNVEKNGEAWYVNPQNNKRYYLGRPSDAFQIMRKFGLGINEINFQKIAQFGMPVDGEVL